MKVGIPKGLLYYKYYPFLQSFFGKLGAEIITSPETNSEILNLGVRHCVDEACLPVKIFHGHVAAIKDHCDMVVIPRIMQIRPREFICPKFCGLPEMVLNSLPQMPPVTTAPIYATSPQNLYRWAEKSGKMITNNKGRIQEAFLYAWQKQKQFTSGYQDKGYSLNVALVGHPYNLYDSYINMNLIKKLHRMGVGVITEEAVPEENIAAEVKELYKRPFWTFARNSYGFAVHIAKTAQVNGIIYISSFACGIDSVVVELIKNKLGDYPLLIIKLDEHTGEAGLDTRVEAFIEMIERSIRLENNLSAHG